ncbi:LacI family DNA-binding transcriptional regulator [Carboxylicivirga sp. N1Y90]|uniref:LacI family DNA-binding transcriptional regulator n=1 Tax=Carboxylicivirga fragile TaxID=3417571 RepID=UPI003D349C63|nr:LacI family DNA-binding transcriptional regulator [Marinilabiliaceae bacterium N1Y90]
MAKGTSKSGEITINDIAKELNIAASTVSRALNNSTKISEATKQKVRKVAEELGYEINLVASSLSKNKTNLIGVVIPNINSQFFAHALSGIQEEAKAAGYNVIISQTNESYEQEVEVMKVMNSARVDGLIVSLTMETKSTDHFNALVRKSVPIVMFDRVNFSVPGPKIVVDNYEASFKATQHLIGNGCKRIAHLAGNLSCKVFEDRAEGFKEALNKNILPLLPQFLLACDLNEKDTREAMKLWMSLDERPDGIVVASASSGLMIASIARSYGVTIPGDLAIISLGNERCNELMIPSISAVDMPGSEMGKAAAINLIETIKTGHIEDRIILKPIQLLMRNSTFKMA